MAYIGSWHWIERHSHFLLVQIAFVNAFCEDNISRLSFLCPVYAWFVGSLIMYPQRISFRMKGDKNVAGRGLWITYFITLVINRIVYITLRSETGYVHVVRTTNIVFFSLSAREYIVCFFLSDQQSDCDVFLLTAPRKWIHVTSVLNQFFNQVYMCYLLKTLTLTWALPRIYLSSQQLVLVPCGGRGTPPTLDITKTLLFKYIENFTTKK